MPKLPGEFVLTQRCLATVAEQLELTLPATVAREPVYYEEGEWQRELDSAHAELAHLALSHRGAPTPALVDSLDVLCRGAVEFFGFVTATDRTYSLHVAARGQDAVFAALANDEIILRPAEPESLVSTLLGELPQATPAGGRSLLAAEAELRNPESARGDARRVLELVNKPRRAGGRIATAVRTGIDNRRTTCPDPIDFIDLEEGRWLTYVTDGGSGGRYVTAAPGRTETIARKLAELQLALR